METINYYPSDTTIGSLLFSNYISEEIRCLRVKELTSSHAIDRLGVLISDSPYDLALGPFDKKNDRCFTSIRQQFIKDFEARAFKTKKKFCPNCNTPVRALRADSHTKLFYSQGVSNKHIKVYQESMSNVR
ncbi:unnamed protein product [Rotaria sp. Silwood1]|nr:unnamed protein product [Rotaria sp. Silwood1]